MFVTKSHHLEVCGLLKKQLEASEAERKALLERLIGSFDTVQEVPVAAEEKEKTPPSHLSQVLSMGRSAREIAANMTAKLARKTYKESPQSVIDTFDKLTKEAYDEAQKAQQ